MSRWPRVILHADMDAFFAAVEQLDDPSLRGRPVIVGHPSPRSVVSTASYEARPFGVGSAMSMVEARRRCPHAVVVPPRFERYQEVSALIMEVFGHYSPAVEALSLDEAFLDLTGSERLLGPPEQAAERLRREVRAATGGLTVSVGIAATKFVAKVASDVHKPDGLTVVPLGETLSFLAPLPVRRLWGVGKKTEPLLHELGLRTIGDVAAMDVRVLRSRLGSLGEHLHALARGEDPRAVDSDRSSHSIGSEQTLERDVFGAAAIRPFLLDAADEVARRLRACGLRARGVRVKLKTTEFRLESRQRSLDQATDTAAVLYETACELLGHFALDEEYRLVGLAAFDLASEREPQQLGLFGGETRARQTRLDRALDTVRERFGKDALQRATSLERKPRS